MRIFFNRPGVAGAALQTPSWLSHAFSDGLWKYVYGAARPQRLDMVLSVIKGTKFKKKNQENLNL